MPDGAAAPWVRAWYHCFCSDQRRSLPGWKTREEPLSQTRYHSVHELPNHTSPRDPLQPGRAAGRMRFATGIGSRHRAATACAHIGSASSPSRSSHRRSRSSPRRDRGAPRICSHAGTARSSSARSDSAAPVIPACLARRLLDLAEQPLRVDGRTLGNAAAQWRHLDSAALGARGRILPLLRRVLEVSHCSDPRGTMAPRCAHSSNPLSIPRSP